MALLKKPVKATATKYQPTAASASGYTGKTGTAASYNASQANGASYNAADATAGTYTGAEGNSSNYTAANGESSNYTADQRNVESNQTVAGQMDGLLNKNSDYMKRAETKGLQVAGSRGLLNTDFAASAAHGAAIDAAMPIAQQDASTYANQSLTNQGYSNQSREYNATNDQNMTIQNMNADNAASQFNAASDQDMTRANMDSSNEANKFNAGQTTQVNQGNQDAQNTASQYNASNSQQATLANQAANNRANEFNATSSQDMTRANMDSENAANQFSAANQQQTNLANQNAQNEANQFNASADNRVSEFNATTAFNTWSQQAQQQHQVVMENLSGENKEKLIQVEMDYKRIIDGEKNASSAYQQAIDAMGNALGNSALSAKQQQRAVDEITSQLGAFLDFSQAITGGEYSTGEATQQTQDYNETQSEAAIAAKAAADKELADLKNQLAAEKAKNGGSQTDKRGSRGGNGNADGRN